MNQILTETEYRRRIKAMASADTPAAWAAASGGHGMFLFFGEEDYLKQNAVRVTREALIGDAAAFDFISLDASSYTPAALASALAAPPMLAAHKLTVLSLSFADMKQGELNELFDLLEDTEDDGTNVVLINTPEGGFDGGTPKRPSAMLTRLSARLTPVRFDRISGARLAAWAGKHYQSCGVSAPEQVCAFTVEHCGADMFRLSAEIRKVSFLVLARGRNTVTAEDVRTAACTSEEFDSFALANAMMARQYPKALDVLSAMKARKEEPARIMGDIIRVICDMTAVSLCMRAGMNQQETAEATGIKPFPLSRYLAVLKDGSITPEILSRSLALAGEADAGVKGGGQDYVPIERLICSL